MSWAATGQTLVPDSVVHDRAFGTTVVTRSTVNIAPTSVVHTRAFGTPQLNKVISLTSPNNTSFKQGLVASQSVSADPDWSGVTVENLWDDDAAEASVTVSPGQFSEDLITAQHGFQVPAGAVIVGLEVEFVITQALSGNSNFVPGITRDGITQAANKFVADPGVGTLVVGSPTDAWSIGLIPSEVNAATFGTWSNIEKVGGSSSTFAIDRIRIKVYYTTHGALDRNTVARIIPSPRVSYVAKPSSVVHTRAFGTTILTVSSRTLTVPSVVHTRAFGAVAVVPDGIVRPPSVVHTRAFGDVVVSGAGQNPAIIQRRIGMQDEWGISGFEENPRQQT